MASQWYVEVQGKAVGPFTAKQLRAQVAANRIQPETRLRRGTSDHWHLARDVKGLLDKQTTKPRAVGMDNPEPARSTAPQHATAAARTSSTPAGTFLAPLRNRKRRLIIYLCLVAFILIGQSPLHQQLFFYVTVGLLMGSYPVVEVKKKTIRRTWMVFFYPVHTEKLRLRDFVGVETAREPRIADQVGCLVLLFFWYWFLFRLFDHIFPWLGGNYKLTLRHYDDEEEVVIWQGNNTNDFEANLAVLESTGLPIL